MQKQTKDAKMKEKSTISELIELYKIPTHTISSTMKKTIKKMIPDYNWTKDARGNLYGSHPESTSNVVLSAHLDMVKTGKDLEYVINSNGILFGVDKNFEPTSLGADDKNGLWCIIQASKHPSRPHIVLFEDEEIGRQGSQDCNIDWFKDKDCCIVIDRKGENEIIVEGMRGGYTSLLGPIFKMVNPEWKFEKGLSCDADSIKCEIDVINISCGYYNAHTKDEYTVLSELEGTLQAVWNFLDNDWSGLPWDAIKEFHRHKFGEYKAFVPQNYRNNVSPQACTEDDEDLTFDEWSRMQGAI